VRDRYTEPVFRAFFDSALASGSAFSIVERASDSVIGSSRYHDHDPAKREIEIGWTFLARAWWGGNTNREVKDLMLGHAFAFVDTVVFWVGETNWRSQRAMEKIGGIRRAEPGTRVLDGKAYSHVVFEIQKRTFKRGTNWPQTAV
jgi:RimJ/RimL family protein N-acetyltransferase